MVVFYFSFPFTLWCWFVKSNKKNMELWNSSFFMQTKTLLGWWNYWVWFQQWHASSHYVVSSAHQLHCYWVLDVVKFRKAYSLLLLVSLSQHFLAFLLGRIWMCTIDFTLSIWKEIIAIDKWIYELDLINEYESSII